MIYLVRHGQSEWNVLRLTQGQTPHPPLTGLGRRQAAAAAEAIRSDLGDRMLREIVTSDLDRAVETARLVADTLPAQIRLDPRLREQDLGSFEGLSYDEAFTDGAELDWTDPDMRVGGGESAGQVMERTRAALADLDAALDTVVVSHGDTIRSILGWVAGVAPGQVPWAEVPNGSVVVLEAYLPPRWLAVPELLLPEPLDPEAEPAAAPAQPQP